MRGYQAGLLLVGLWLAACGSVKREDFDAELATAVCEKYVRCGLSYDADSCEQGLAVGFLAQHGLNAQYSVAINAGQMHYDADAAEKCLEKIRSGPCDVDPLSSRMLLEGVGMSADCRFLFGEVADGEACRWSGECGAPSVCSSTAPWYCGTCQPKRAEGAQSPSSLLCMEGLVSFQSTCQQPLKEGQSCDQPGIDYSEACEPDLICDSDSLVCRRLASKGEACDLQSHRCAWNLACIDGTCHALNGKGESCTAQAANVLDLSGCQRELFCDADPGAPGRCRPRLVDEGSSCRDYRECGRGLYCEGSDTGSGQRGTCRRLAREGESCDGRVCNFRFYCSESSRTCMPRRQFGESCADEASSCALGLSCNGRTCGGLDYNCHP
ncbi:hypothetical protein [Vitiosangium sp. GDMCC 1.1324]|uniref:hypothetical protein n=1 Tax=Vitiosangium sp. (strain GDMCC 1.1324) TaxID=2138576 RepID=UPI000D3B57A6|nr:hypothetical protein [Vitiosangium sp. GDMCC 1.1324]PTL79969.1 hypothetical protein DAT35_31605 [Vitiosangium sp. GDMCC 1.1324]